jgi:hypothetical protein
VALALLAMESGKLSDYAGKTLEEMELDPEQLGLNLGVDDGDVSDFDSEDADSEESEDEDFQEQPSKKYVVFSH